MTELELEVFLAVAGSGSLSAAAQGLHITQPAVSRHIRALEEELDCTLLVRGRGVRRVELTEQGRDFIEVARRWQQVWREAREVTARGRERRLSVASVGSVSTSLLPAVFRTFLEEDGRRTLSFHSAHSSEAYPMVADGVADLAFVTDHMYHPQVEAAPAFRQSMVLLAGRESGLGERVHPSQLDPGKELRLPWYPEYDLWHTGWFSGAARPRAVLDQMSLLEEFLRWENWGDSWVIAPTLVAERLQERTEVTVHLLEEGPPDEIIWYLLRRRRKPELIRAFLNCLERELARRDGTESLLGKEGSGPLSP